MEISYLCSKVYTMIADCLLEYGVIEEEDGSILRVESVPWRGLADELAELHFLHGASFIKQLKLITYYGVFHTVENETNIFSTGGERSEDYNYLLDAARKAVEHGYRVFILPNPKGFRTADFIFERKGVYKMFDLKTIHGKSSVMNRLYESVGQTNHVLLNMTINYRAISLASCIKKYFEINPNAIEILVFKGNKEILVKRSSTESKDFFKTFAKRYNK